MRIRALRREGRTGGPGGSQLDKLAGEYKGGLFISGGREKYRMDRIRQVCIKAVEAIGKQLEEGAVQRRFSRKNSAEAAAFSL